MEVDASETTYELVAVLSEKNKSNEKSNMTGIVAMSRRAGGKGITFGAEATTDGLVSEWDAQFNKTLKVGSIDYTITDEEYAELEALIASISV